MAQFHYYYIFNYNGYYSGLTYERLVLDSERQFTNTAVDKLNEHGLSNTAHHEGLPKETKVLATEGLSSSINKLECSITKVSGQCIATHLK